MMSVSHMRGYGKFTWMNEVHFWGVRWESNTTGVFNLQLGPKKRTSAKERRGKKPPKCFPQRWPANTVKNVVGFLQNVPRLIVGSELCFKNISQILWPGTFLKLICVVRRNILAYVGPLFTCRFETGTASTSELELPQASMQLSLK